MAEEKELGKGEGMEWEQSARKGGRIDYKK